MAFVFGLQQNLAFLYFKMKDLQIKDILVHLFDFLHSWPLSPDAVGAE